MSVSKSDLPDTSDSFFRNLLETAPDAMLIIDHKGKIVVVNSQAERMFGYLREELLGEDIEMLLPEDRRHRHVRQRSGYRADPHVRPMGKDRELFGLRNNGSQFPVEISLSPVSTDFGSYVSSVIRDVTERKEMEREITAARQEAERANKANTAFLAAASHDLRQPVQALTLLNGALRRTVKDDAALRMIESQQMSLDAMTNLLNSLLDISRLDAGAIEPRISSFPLQQIIDHLSAEFSRQASQKGLTFHAEPSDICVRSDPDLLSEIIQNLVSNAIRYTNKGDVRLRCEIDGDQVCVRVSDTGVGIEEQHLQDVFREFHQIKSPGQKTEGFGLGLAIVQRMSDLLKHQIEVESTPGEGSEFSVCVPVAELSVRDTGAGNDIQRRSVGRQGTVILIEDDTAVADALTLLLESEGLVVASATSASEAKAVTRHLDDPPDLIISDYHLIDNSTGLDAVNAIREIVDDLIPAFIVTGDTSMVVDEAKHLRNSILIRKPVDPEQLIADAAEAIETGEVPRSSGD